MAWVCCTLDDVSFLSPWCAHWPPFESGGVGTAGLPLLGDFSCCFQCAYFKSTNLLFCLCGGGRSKSKQSNMFEMNINLSDGSYSLGVPFRVNFKNVLASLWQLKGQGQLRVTDSHRCYAHCPGKRLHTEWGRGWRKTLKHEQCNGLLSPRSHKKTHTNG